MFAKAVGHDHPFSSTVRIKLIMDIINNDEEDCCNLNLRKIVQDGSRTILHYYPLHDPAARDALSRNWFGWRVHPWLQPLTQVKEYVGEKIGLYFAFTGHYTTWLAPLCVASAVVIVYFLVLYVMEGTLVDALNNGFMVPFFCIFVAIWAQLMLEYWKRKQSRLAMEWGQTEFEEEEDERPEFQQTDMRYVGCDYSRRLLSLCLLSWSIALHLHLLSPCRLVISIRWFLKVAVASRSSCK
jgi:hypothetical protein